MMRRHATWSVVNNASQPDHPASDVVLVIEGVEYFTAAYVARTVGVTRQTLWRWRQEAKVPLGRRYRDRQILYTRSELASVAEYAHRLEPLDNASPDQLRLFAGKGTGTPR